MTQAKVFADAWFTACANIINDLEVLRTLNDRVAADSGLLAAALTAEVGRTDLTTTDMTNASAAVTQLLLFKML
jgi:hypothetical protein